MLKRSIWAPCLCYDILYAVSLKYFSGIIALIYYIVCEIAIFMLYRDDIDYINLLKACGWMLQQNASISWHCMFVIITHICSYYWFFSFQVTVTILANKGERRTLCNYLRLQSPAVIFVLYVIFYHCFLSSFLPTTLFFISY